MMLFDLIISIVTVLSFAGSFILLIFLQVSERSAPSFAESVRGLGPVSTGRKSVVSVIVPARNEDEDIARCLDSLLAQSYKNVEIIVVDDSSNDTTFEVAKNFAAKYPQIRAIQAGPKPDTWVGKGWPCWRGYEESGGSYLLFVDADSTLSPQLIESSIEYLEEKQIDMFSLSPKVELHGLVARAVLPLVTGAINILYPMQKVNDPKSDRAYVFGTFVLVRRDSYERFGGHARVKGEIVEDAALARAAKVSGFRLRIEKGPEFVSTLWEKEARNVYDGLERVTSSSVRSYGLLSILNAILIFFISIVPILFVATFAIIHPGNSILLLGLVGSVLNIVTLFAFATLESRTITGRTEASAILYPVGCILFISAIVSTSIKVSRRMTIRWKGRSYLQEMQR